MGYQRLGDLDVLSGFPQGSSKINNTSADQTITNPIQRQVLANRIDEGV